MQRWPTDAIRGKAKKPDDWDDEEDGEWEAPMIDNPEYKGHFGFKTGNANMECHEIVEDLFVWILHFRLECCSCVALPTCFKGLQGSEHIYLFAVYYSLQTLTQIRSCRPDLAIPRQTNPKCLFALNQSIHVAKGLLGACSWIRIILHQQCCPWCEH